jgi:hypothetical protein
MGNNINKNKILGRNVFGIIPSIITSYDPDFQLVIDAIQSTGVTLTTTEKNAGNTLVIDSKNNGFWVNSIALYGFLGGTAGAHKWNWKNPLDTNAAFRLVYSTGFIHNNNGMQGNGTSAFADTFIIPSVNLNSSNNHMLIYSRTETAQNMVEFGSYSVSGLTYYNLQYIKSSGNLYVLANGNTSFPNYNNPSSLGLFSMSKFNSNTASGFKNGNKVIDSQLVGTGISTQKLYLGASNNNGTAGLFSSRQISFASVGNSLSDLQQLNAYNTIQAYQTTLNRNV